MLARTHLQAKQKAQQYRKYLNKDPDRTYYPTNNIMIDEKSKIIYLPGFMRLKFKNFNDMDIGSLSALLNGEIIFVIYYGEAFESFGEEKENFIQQNLMQKIVLLFARDNAIKLTNDEVANKDKELDIKVNHDKKKHQIKFVVKKIFKLYLDSEVFLTPFEVINGILEITVQSIQINYRPKETKKEDWKIQFNLQNNSDINEKVQFANWGTFGNYDLAEKRIGALYTNYRISEAKDFRMSTFDRIQNQRKKNMEIDKQKGSEQIIERVKEKLENSMSNSFIDEAEPLRIDFKQKETKIEAFHYAYFNIPLYKFPLSALITIFMPLFFLDVLNFGILFQDPSLSDRIAAIATLVLAFAALIPTIRSQIPPNPRITLIEILVYLQTIPTLLAIIQSLDVYYQSVDSFVYNWGKNGFFWVAFSISVITFCIILVLVTLHYCKWYSEYNAVATREEKPMFDRKRWRNTQCNLYFDQFFSQKLVDNDKITMISISKKHFNEVYSIPQQTVKKIKKMLKKQSFEQKKIKELK